MDSLFFKILTILLIFIGEAFAVYAEMIAAKTNIISNLFFRIFSKAFLIIILGGGFLIVGYMLGIKSFKNIWIVSVISITSILIIEPILAYTIFKQMPTKGALIGLILGIVGFIAAIFF